MSKKGIVLFFILSATAGFAQQSKSHSFSLEEAISFALDSNYTAINARRDIAKAIKRK